METQQRIDILESRQLELRAVMAKSDDRAAKCTKSGLDFRATYPLDYEEYEAANAEYNHNEDALGVLYEQRRRERDEEKAAFEASQEEQV